MTSRGQVSPITTLTQSSHSKKPLQGIKKTEERLTSISHAKMGQGKLQSGSNNWTGGKWWGIQMMMPQGTSLSSWTSMPRKNTITMTMMTRQGHSPSGSSPYWWEVAPPSWPSVRPSTNSPLTIGGLWPKSIGIGQWTSSVKASLPKLTSSSRRCKRLRWNGALAKGGLRWPKPIDTSAVSVSDKQGPDTSRTRCEGMYSIKHNNSTVVDMDVHSDEKCGVTSLGSPGHHLTQLPL